MTISNIDKCIININDLEKSIDSNEETFINVSIPKIERLLQNNALFFEGNLGNSQIIWALGYLRDRIEILFKIAPKKGNYYSQLAEPRLRERVIAKNPDKTLKEWSQIAVKIDKKAVKIIAQIDAIRSQMINFPSECIFKILENLDFYELVDACSIKGMDDFFPFAVIPHLNEGIPIWRLEYSKTVLGEKKALFEFFEKHGEQIHTLDISERRRFLEEEDVKKILSFCPNVTNLSCKFPNILENFNLKLEKLSIVGFKGNLPQNALAKIAGLKDISLENTNIYNLKEVDFPSSLESLLIQECNNPFKLSPKIIRCPNLSEISIFNLYCRYPSIGLFPNEFREIESKIHFCKYPDS